MTIKFILRAMPGQPGVVHGHVEKNISVAAEYCKAR